MGFQKPCSSRHADEALSCVPVLFDKSGTDSLKTLKEKKTELVKKANNVKKRPSKSSSKVRRREWWVRVYGGDVGTCTFWEGFRHWA